MAEAAHTIHVDIVSAEGEIFSGSAEMVFAPAIMGELGIAPRHAPPLTLLKAGEVRVKLPGGEEQSFFVGGRALEVQPKHVTVRGERGLRAKDIDEAGPLPSEQKAEAAMKNRGGAVTQAEPLAD